MTYSETVENVMTRDRDYFNALLQSGLDHLMLVFQFQVADSWKILKTLLDEDLFITIHLTITNHNSSQIPSVIDQLAEAGVQAISISTDDSGLSDAVYSIRNLVASRNIELVWNIPVPYSSFNPIALETSQAGYSEGIGRDWMYVEPDGDVLPGQGINRVLGNLLSDPWELIWKRK